MYSAFMYISCRHALNVGRESTSYQCSCRLLTLCVRVSATPTSLAHANLFQLYRCLLLQRPPSTTMYSASGLIVLALKCNTLLSPATLVGARLIGWADWVVLWSESWNRGTGCSNAFEMTEWCALSPRDIDAGIMDLEIECLSRSDVGHWIVWYIHIWAGTRMPRCCWMMQAFHVATFRYPTHILMYSTCWYSTVCKSFQAAQTLLCRVLTHVPSLYEPTVIRPCHSE